MILKFFGFLVSSMIHGIQFVDRNLVVTMSIIQLKTSDGLEFFRYLELFIGLKIPVYTVKILIFHGYDNVYSLSRFDANSLIEMEKFMREKFKSKMLDNEDEVNQYLGDFCDNQSDFRFVSGQIRIFKSLADVCASMYHKDEVTIPDTTSAQGSHPFRNSLGFFLNEWTNYRLFN